MHSNTNLLTLDDKNVVGFTGGVIKLLPSQNIPKCEICQTQMNQFLCLTITKAMNLPYETGSQLHVFCCPNHGDIPDEQYSDLDDVLQSTYQNEVHQHYSVVFNKPADFMVKGETTELLKQSLSIEEVDEEIELCDDRGEVSTLYESKIGGVPTWLNYSVNLKCTCGANLNFLCQIEENQQFTKENATSPSDYELLFNGNYIYILACEKQCTPYSNVVVTDN